MDTTVPLADSTKQLPNKSPSREASEESRGDGSEATTATSSVQDSGICLSREDTRAAPRQQQQEKHSPYVTSTPKKSQPLPPPPHSSCSLIRPSEMILDDPLLSSIDEPDDESAQQVESLMTDDEEVTQSGLFVTQLGGDSDPTRHYSTLSRFMNDVTPSHRIRSQSYSDIKQNAAELDNSSIKKNLFDIPVSPKLKHRVRERLYTLVNSLDGYKGKVQADNRNIDSLFHKTIHVPSRCKQEGNIGCGSVSPRRYASHGDFQVLGSCLSDRSLDRGKNNSMKLGTSQQEEEALLNNSTLSERCTTAITTVLESQLNTLQLHQNKLNEEKIALVLQRKEEEVSAKIAIYEEKLQLMMQMLEEQEGRVSSLQQQLKQQSTHYQENLTKQQQTYQQQLHSKQLELEKKAKAAEERVAGVQQQVVESYHNQMSELLASTRERSALQEREHSAQLHQLSAVISRLRVEKRELEASLARAEGKDWAQIIPGTVTETHEAHHTSREPNLTCGVEQPGGAAPDTLTGLDILKTVYQEEVSVWKAEADKLRHQLAEAEARHKTGLDEALQVWQTRLREESERGQQQAAQNSLSLNTTISALQEKLSQSVAEISSLKQQLSQVQTREAELTKQVREQAGVEEQLGALQDHVQQLEKQLVHQQKQLRATEAKHRQDLADTQDHYRHLMLNHQLCVEREQVGEEESQALLASLSSRYQVLLHTERQHARAQINEYRKAVRLLKLKIRKLEEGHR